MRRNDDNQWKRYVSKYGILCIDRQNRNNVSFIPAHTPHISVPVSREKAATGLRLWRKEQA